MEQVEQVNVFKYLGVLLEKTGNMENETNKKISNAARTYHGLNNPFLRRKEVNKNTKTTNFNLHGEGWVLTKPLSSKILTVDIKLKE